MFHYLFSGAISPFVSAISVRALLSVITSFGLTLLLVPIVIRRINERKAGQNVRTDGPSSHQVKSGRPTMGGIAMIIAILVTCGIWARFNEFTVAALAASVWLAAIGFLDDLWKFLKKNTAGISARAKMVGQGAFGLALGLYILKTGLLPPTLQVPGFHVDLPLGWLYVPFVAFVVVGTSNAVNLTDGLDGLAIGVVIVVASAFGGIAYLTGNRIFSTHVHLLHVPGSGELTVFCAALVGSGLGFLWYNAPPAQIFMGDIGSLMLGGAIGTVAVLTKTEILLVLIGGIFVIEAVSVILQVASFRLRGKRIFKMAPIHHHFELSGWAETKVVSRFIIVTIIFTLAGLSLVGLNVLLDGR